MTRNWGALLTGHAFDLEDWLESLRPEFDPWTERHGTEVVLRSRSFASLSAAGEVRERSISLIGVLNGALAVSRRADPVAFGGVVEFGTNGEMHRTVFASLHVNLGRVRAAAVGVAIGPDGQPLPPPSPGPSEVQSWLSIAEADEVLADALVFYGGKPNWFDIYKAVECLERFAGGGEAALLERNWAAPSDVKLMKRTANFARHANAVRPPKAMEISEARSLLAHLLRAALTSTHVP